VKRVLETQLRKFARWYLRDFSFQRGKGAVNKLLGKFLRITTKEGTHIRLTNPLEYNQRLLLYDETSYEPEVTSAISSVLESGHTFFDVGANLGYYTLLASMKVGSDGSVHAFEPAPAQFKHLNLNMRVNRATNIILNNVALAETAGEREMLLSLGWNQGIHSFAATEGPATSTRVSCATLDEYVVANGIRRIDAMKLDVEGAELLILRGSVETLRSLAVPVIFFETCEHHARKFGYSTVEVKYFLRQLGYEIFRLISPSGLEPAGDLLEEFANLVAIHSTSDTLLLRALSGASHRNN